eukprot:m51a1_g3764 putative peptidylprolyl isomerase (601) ;mRNA; f:120731-124042
MHRSGDGGETDMDLMEPYYVAPSWDSIASAARVLRMARRDAQVSGFFSPRCPRPDPSPHDLEWSTRAEASCALSGEFVFNEFGRLERARRGAPHLAAAAVIVSSGVQSVGDDSDTQTESESETEDDDDQPSPRQPLQDLDACSSPPSDFPRKRRFVMPDDSKEGMGIVLEAPSGHDGDAVSGQVHSPRGTARRRRGILVAGASKVQSPKNSENITASAEDYSKSKSASATPGKSCSERPRKRVRFQEPDEPDQSAGEEDPVSSRHYAVGTLMSQLKHTEAEGPSTTSSSPTPTDGAERCDPDDAPCLEGECLMDDTGMPRYASLGLPDDAAQMDNNKSIFRLLEGAGNVESLYLRTAVKRVISCADTLDEDALMMCRCSLQVLEQGVILLTDALFGYWAAPEEWTLDSFFDKYCSRGLSLESMAMFSAYKTEAVLGMRFKGTPVGELVTAVMAFLQWAEGAWKRHGDMDAPSKKQQAKTAPKKGGKAAATLQIDTLRSAPTAGGREAKEGDWIKVHYVGKLVSNGKQFDSSRERGQPFQFKIGQGSVIKGWEQGVIGMSVGELRRLTIPASLGYGKKGAGSAIPPNSDLEFEIECLGIQD